MPRENRLSVLIPIYNSLNDLTQSLNSLALVQTPFDILIVDDGSEPPIQLPDLIGGHSVVLLRLQNNGGIEDALNTGLRYIIEQDYELVARLDAGDICMPQRFNKQLKFMDENPHIMLVGSHVEHFDTSGNIIFIQCVPLELDLIKRKMHLNSCFVHPAVMMRVSAIKAIGFYSPAYPAAEDYEYFFRFVKLNAVHNLDEILTRKEINPKSISLSRRRVQLRSRLKIQIKYFNPKIIESYMGIFKTIVLYFIPNKLVIRIKKSLLNLFNKN